MSYSHLLDYFGDLRAPERLTAPPGGSAGCSVSDVYLCVVAELAKRHADPLTYLRGVALNLSDSAAPDNWQCAALTRIASWCEEWRRAAA